MSALGELQQVLHAAEDQLREVRGQLGQGHRALGEARAALARLDPHNPDVAVPPGFDRAVEQIERVMAIIDQADDVLRDFAGRL